MELPIQFQNLYRHWKWHTIGLNTRDHPDVSLDPKVFIEIKAFVHERMEIWKKKTNGDTPPFTNDPILKSYRFCNIFREFDRQTIEFHTILNPFRKDFTLWLLNMFFFRMVARTETIQSVGMLSFDKKENEEVYKRLMALPRPRFGTPYVFPVSTILRSTTPTREQFIARHLPTVMKRVAQEILSWNKMSVLEGVGRILPIFGYKHTFLWTEVLIDVAYQFPEHIDLFKEFPVGPGSAPTFRKISKELNLSRTVCACTERSFSSGLTYKGKPIFLSAENWEGIGCEFRKYQNLQNGKGRKRLFRT